MTKTLENARKVAQSSATSLDALTERAEAASRRLELMMASLHDLPEERPARPSPAPAPAPEPVESGTLFLSQRSRVAGAAK
jgi:hypothetical protein